MSTLDDAIEYIRTGQKAEGRQILEEMLDVDENNEEVWLWLSTVVDTDEDREICLENTLAIDPNSVVASKGLEALRAGIFNPEDVLRELLDEKTVGEEGQVTFIDEFAYADDDGQDDEEEGFDEDELVIPGQQKARRGLNVRFIVLGVLIVGLVVILGGLALVSIFMLGDNDSQPVDTPQSQEVPVQEEATPQPTATPTETPTPGVPTTTPTPRLQLPTLAPTEPPTPTATRVVSPTPIRN